MFTTTFINNKHISDSAKWKQRRILVMYGSVSPVCIRSSFMPIFSFLCPSVLDFRSCTGQTNGQTDNGHHCIMPPPYWDSDRTMYMQLTEHTAKHSHTLAKHNEKLTCPAPSNASLLANPAYSCISRKPERRKNGAKPRMKSANFQL